MKDGLLSERSDHSSKPLRDHLKREGKHLVGAHLLNFIPRPEAAIKANQVFLPVLENSSKATKLRATLSVFERSKFFFNLPGFLVETIEAARYEAALRDYKKGKMLLETRPGQLLPIGTPNDGQSLAAAEKQQKRILNKVWVTVEKAMGEMRKVLLAKLQDPSRTVEEQEKTIEYAFAAWPV